MDKSLVTSPLSHLTSTVLILSRDPDRRYHGMMSFFPSSFGFCIYSHGIK